MRAWFLTTLKWRKYNTLHVSVRKFTSVHSKPQINQYIMAMNFLNANVFKFKLLGGLGHIIYCASLFIHSSFDWFEQVFGHVYSKDLTMMLFCSQVIISRRALNAYRENLRTSPVDWPMNLSVSSVHCLVLLTYLGHPQKPF